MTDIRPARTVADLMTVTGLSKPTVLKLLNAGQLPGRKHGKRWVITADQLDAYCSYGVWPITPAQVPTPIRELVRRKTA